MSSNSNCIPEETLIAIVERTLSPNEIQVAETHLEECRECAMNLGRVRKNLLRELGAEIEVDISDKSSADMGEASTQLQPSDSTPQEYFEPVKEAGYIGKLKEYQLVKVIGRGGFGIVFEARDSVLHRKVAIKILTRDLASDPRARRRFIREARAGAAINHQNVVTIHGVEESDQVPFIIMELIQGESLRDRIHRSPKLDFMDVLRIAAQTAQGLAAAQAQGIIHRDVKPGNIMLVDGCRVKITDFGLARVTVDNVELTSRGLVVGTPAYMSPEQVRGEELDSRSDLFAFGCVMYAMFAGHSPFHGRTMLDIAHRIESFDPPSLAAVAKDVPQFMSDIVDKLLKKDRDKRYQSAAEVADLLNQHLAILNQTPTDHLQSALRSPVLKTPAPHRFVPQARILAAAVLIAGLGIGSLWFLPQGNNKVVDSQTEVAGNPGTGNSERASNTLPLTPPAKRMALVTVAQSGPADFKTIGEALRHIERGGELKILDDKQYVESLRLDDAHQFSGIRIVAPQGATIRSNVSGPVIAIQAVPRVQIEGLKIVAWQSQFAIEVQGESPGVKLVDLQIERVDNPDGKTTSNAGVVLRKSAAGSIEEPILLHHLVLQASNVGIVIGNSTSGEAPVRHIVVEECVVHGLNRETSTLLALIRNAEDIQVQRNIFTEGSMGLSILGTDELCPVRCRVSQNTWLSVKNWVGWTGFVPPEHSIRLSDNLIVDSQQVVSPPLRAVLAMPGEPVFSGNLVAHQSGDVLKDFSALASMASGPIHFLSRDPAHVDYLKPDLEHPNESGLRSAVIPGRYSAK